MSRLNLHTNIIAIDTETTGLNPWRPRERWGIYPDRPFAFSFCDSKGNTDYVRWEINPKDRQVYHDKKTKRQMRLLLADTSITKIFHNISFDYRMLAMSGLKPKGKLNDTIFMAHVVTGGAEKSYGLKPLGKQYLDISDEDQNDLVKSVHKGRRLGKKNKWAIAQKETHGQKPVFADYWLGDKDLCKKYAITDAERTMMLYLAMKDDLTPELKRVYQREMNLLWVTMNMETVGCRVHPKDIKRLRQFYQNYMDKQMRLVYRNGGKGLNFNSPKQMQAKFYDELGFKPKINENGNRSLDAHKLVELSEKSKLAKAILEWKAGDHMMSSFLNPYERFMVKEGPSLYVLHPKYKQCGPITGRFSCSDPNLMNVASEKTGARKTDIALKPRECLGPRNGYIWLMPDWSQIEVWIFAFLAQDKTMMNALLKGKDFHATNATKVWGKKSDFKKNSGIYRKRAKGLFFSLLYGGGKRTVSIALNCSALEAQTLIEEFKDELPGIQDFMDRTMNEVYDSGEVKNPFGRKYIIPEDYAYKGVNYKVQGTAADIAKRAMIRIHKSLKQWPDSNIILMLHDEFAIEIPKKYNCYKLRKQIINDMQADHKKLNIPSPFPVDMDLITSRWSESQAYCRKHLKICGECK